MADRPTTVPPGFSLPWNTTRSMADVWRDDREAKRAAQRERALAMHKKRRHKATLGGKPVRLVDGKLVPA